MVGYRNEELYGSGERDLEAVIEFEISELENLDIPYTLLDSWELSASQKRKLKNLIKSAEDYVDEDIELLVEYCIALIKNTYPQANYCLWLGSKDSILKNYEGSEDNLDCYKIEITQPISDLGFNAEGCLFIFTKNPQPITTESTTKSKNRYVFNGTAEFYNRTLGEWRHEKFGPATVNAVSEAQALNNIKFRIRDKYELPVNARIALFDYTLEIIPDVTYIEPARQTQKCDSCGTLLTDAGECPKCDLLDDRYNESIKKLTINEDFMTDLIPGESYYFIKNDKVYQGKFKRKTNAWYFFEDEDGKEIMASAFTSISDNKEELKNLLGLVDRIEKDTKIPPQVPNKYTRVPNQHNKPVGESYKKLDEASVPTIYFMHITEFDETLYSIGKTSQECLYNMLKALDYAAQRFGGYDDYAEYLEIEHNTSIEKVYEFIENWYGTNPIKINDFIIYGYN